MHETRLLGSLLPAHPDIQPILQTIRKRYGIPTVVPGDDSSREYSLSGKKIDWNAVQDELDFRIRNMSNILPPEMAKIQMMPEARKKTTAGNNLYRTYNAQTKKRRGRVVSIIFAGNRLCYCKFSNALPNSY